MEKIPNIDFMRECRDCGAVILFSNSVVSKSGARIPLDKDGNAHSCKPNDEVLVLAELQRVAELNRRLQSTRLRIVREDLEK